MKVDATSHHGNVRRLQSDCTRITGKFPTVHLDLDLGYGLDMDVTATCNRGRGTLPGDMITVTRHFFLTDRSGATLNPGDVAIVVSFNEDRSADRHPAVQMHLACRWGLVIVDSSAQYFYDHVVRL